MPIELKKRLWRPVNRAVRVLLAVFAAQMCVAAAELSAEVERIVQVQWQESTASVPSQLTGLWQDFRLPYQQPLDTVALPYAWFRFQVAAPANDTLQSLYINNHMYGVQVWMNGMLVGGSTAPPGKQATGWNLPLLVPLPQAYWRSGENEIVVRLDLQRFTNVLASVLVGPDSELRPLWQQRHFWQGKVSLFSFFLCVIMGLFMLGLWTCRRHDTQYLWFGLSSVAWSVPMLYMSVTYAPIPHDVFLVLTLIAINVYAVCALRFVHRMLDLKFPRLERLHVLVISVISVFQLLVSASTIMQLTTLADTLSLLVLLHALVFSVRLARQPDNYQARLFLLMALAALLFFSHDVYEFFSASRSNTSIASGTSMQYAFPVILAAFFLVLIRRFVTALQDSERLNRELEQRVAAIDQQLQASYAANRAWELKEATEKQKQKIYRDLHDDVGARLVSIMHARESGEQSRMAQSALSSLRETVSSGNFQDENLPDLLTDASHNIESRCHNSELSFIAPQLEGLPNVVISGNHCYHLKRILQEVVSNIIKHAGATEVQMQVSHSDNQLIIQLQDDGRGLSPAARAGNGMTNIRFRAREIGGEAVWRSESSVPGCRFELRLTLVPEPAN
jgi:signal transduction histidine kinase